MSTVSRAGGTLACEPYSDKLKGAEHTAI